MLHLYLPKVGLRPSSLLRPLSCLPSRLPPIAGEGNSALSPLNPGELLIALHNIDSVKCDMKSIIKGEAPRFPQDTAPTHRDHTHPQSPTWPCCIKNYGLMSNLSHPGLHTKAHTHMCPGIRWSSGVQAVSLSTYPEELKEAEPTEAQGFCRHEQVPGLS